jgi:hypothetical protein
MSQQQPYVQAVIARQETWEGTESALLKMIASGLILDYARKPGKIAVQFNDVRNPIEFRLPFESAPAADVVQADTESPTPQAQVKTVTPPKKSPFSMSLNGAMMNYKSHVLEIVRFTQERPRKAPEQIMEEWSAFIEARIPK